MDPAKMVEDIDYFMAHGDYERAQAILADLQTWVTETLNQCRNAADNKL